MGKYDQKLNMKAGGVSEWEICGHKIVFCSHMTAKSAGGQQGGAAAFCGIRVVLLGKNPGTVQLFRQTAKKFRLFPIGRK